MAKNKAKAKQHPEAESFSFENYLLSSSTLPSENNRYSKKCTKNNCDCFIDVIWLVAMKMRLKMKYRSQGYDNRLRSRHKTNILNIICLSIMTVIVLSNI